jgi:high affinity Mn2+ porin
MHRAALAPVIALATRLLASAGAALGDETDSSDMPEDWSLHGQVTEVTQYHPPFTSPYRGAHSLDSGHRGDETVDATLYAGIRLAPWAAFYADPEIDQGLGLSNTTGVAGFPSAEAYKVGAIRPYLRLQRAFFRLSFGLGGEVRKVPPDTNRLGDSVQADTLTLTIGKVSVTDIFDDNGYAHDPKSDFLNWAIVDSGTFDYAADPWGYTYGAAAEWTQAWWTLRTGLFDLSRVPNGRALQIGLGEFSVVAEAEERHTILGREGKLKLLGYVDRGRMGDYTAAIRAAGPGGVPDTATVRRFAFKPGLSLNLEQKLTDELGMFVRTGIQDGHEEVYEFTEIDRSFALGLSLSGETWSRPNDTIALAGVVDALSADARAYLAAGGIGVLIGDGRLPHYATERILEAYYSAGVADGITVSPDLQWVVNPAYNRDRGPVTILGLRLHAEF